MVCRDRIDKRQHTLLEMATHHSNGLGFRLQVSVFRFFLFGVFDEFGGVGAGEQVDSPVGEHVSPVEIVAQLVEVDALPDERADPATEVYSQDVDERASFSQIHQLAYGAVAERDRRFVLDPRGEVRGCPLALLFCGLREGGDRWPVVVYAGAISHGVDPGPVFHPQVLVDENPPAMVFFCVQVADQERGLDPGGPDGGAGRYRASVGDHHGIRPDLFDPGVVNHLYSLGGEPARGGVYQRGIEAFENMISGVHQHDANTLEVYVGIVILEHIEDQIVRIGRGLDPGRTSADDDEGEQIVRRSVLEMLGFFEAIDNVIAYPQGVSQSLDVQGVFFGARGAEERRAAARGQDEVIVRVIALVRLHPASLEIHLCCLILKVLYSQGPKDAPEGMGHMAHLRVAGDDRGYHRPKGSVIQVVYQGDAHIFGPAEHARQPPRRGESAESTSDDDYLRRGVRVAPFERGRSVKPPVGPPSRSQYQAAHHQFASHQVLSKSGWLLQDSMSAGQHFS